MLRTVILILSLLSGGAATWISIMVPGPASSGAADTRAAPGVPMEQVLVAAADIVPGAKIDPSLLRWQPWPQDAVSEHYLTIGARPDAIADLAQMTVQSPIMSGEPVHESKLVSGAGGILSVMLASGSRAVAVRINAENTAGGFILPNDRVDVLHTSTEQTIGGTSRINSRAILTNVRVLAIDQMIDHTNGAIVGKTATLELSPTEAEIVTAAQASGDIVLVLRALEDANDPVEQRLTVGPDAGTIRLFRGGQEKLIQLKGI